MCSIGMVLDDMGKHEEALDMFNKSLQIKTRATAPLAD